MPDEIADTELDEWYRRHDGREGPDVVIRRLIDELRRLRVQSGPPCELCGRASTTTVKVLLGQRWSPRCDEHTQ